MKYANLRSHRLLRIPELVWHHGWIPEVWNKDVDQIIGESGETSELPHLTYLVSRRDQELALKAASINDAWAVGLPYAYALKMQEANRPPRIRNSAVVAPGLHGSFSPDSPVHVDTEYLDFLEPRLTGFDCVRVMMNCDDIRLKRHQEWERRGFEVMHGGCATDSTSLSRLADTFQRFEVMTTNDFGSHIAYAAAAGCRMSICGPRPEVDLVGFSLKDELYRNRPELGLSSALSYQLANNYLNSLGLNKDVSEAVDAHEWGLFQIGFDCVKQPGELRRLFSAAYSRHTPVSDRIGFRPVKKKLASSKRLIGLLGLKLNSAESSRIIFPLRNLMSLASMASTESRTLFFGDSGDTIHFRPNSSDSRSLYQVFSERELEALPFSNPHRILDLGCYAGYSTVYLLNRFPNSEVVAVEASEPNYSIAKLNLKGHSRVTLLNKAIWSANAPISLLPGMQGHRSTKTIPYQSELPTVEGITLEKLLGDVGWEFADLIKMDIEGAEYDVLGSVADEMANLCSMLIVSFRAKLARRREVEALTEKLAGNKRALVYEIGRFTVFDFRKISVE